jgi:hypothetical protein
MTALKAIPQNQFQNCFEGWTRYWHRCIASQGEYFEGDHSDIQQWGYEFVNFIVRPLICSFSVLLVLLAKRNLKSICHHLGLKFTVLQLLYEGYCLLRCCIISVCVIFFKLRDLEATVDKKTKELESFHATVSSASCSSPSEDVSIRCASLVPLFIHFRMCY